MIPSILVTIISCNYLNLSLANEYVGDVTIPTQAIKYIQHFLQADQPIRLQFSNQFKIYSLLPSKTTHTMITSTCLSVLYQRD